MRAAIARIMPGTTGAGRAVRLYERNVRVARRSWIAMATGFFEPIFYLVGMGFGVGALVGDIDGLPYAVFVAPALMATSAMNGALYDATFNMFYKLRYAKTYDAVLATPLGPGDIATAEVAWALSRGLLYAVGFVVLILLLGLARSPLVLLAAPAALLIGFATAGIGTAATTFMRRWQDFDLVTVVTLPLFLFSATFFPVTRYPEPLRTFVELTPLYRGTHLLRGLTTGTIDATALLDVAYLVALGLIGLTITSRRLGTLLQK